MRVHSVGAGAETFLVTYLGVIYFVRYLGGSDVFHWSLFSLKGIASSGGGVGGGQSHPHPNIPTSETFVVGEERK